MVQSLFEGSMYTFVFMWTPVLKKAAETADGTRFFIPPNSTVEEIALPFGLIFSCYMVCIMIGSSFFGVMIGQLKMTAENIATILLATSVVSLLLPVFTTVC